MLSEQKYGYHLGRPWRIGGDTPGDDRHVSFGFEEAEKTREDNESLALPCCVLPGLRSPFPTLSQDRIRPRPRQHNGRVSQISEFLVRLYRYMCGPNRQHTLEERIQASALCVKVGNNSLSSAVRTATASPLSFTFALLLPLLSRSGEENVQRIQSSCFFPFRVV